MDKMNLTPDQSNLHLTSADRKRHLMPIARIISDAFAGGHHVDEISQQYIANCHYDWDVSRIIFVGDQLVHHWGVWGYPMRLESAQLKVAGVGAVVTEEPYRRRGLMSMAANDSLSAMKDHGYDLSNLRGRHYVRYGYVRAWNYVTYKLKPDEIPNVQMRLTYKLLGPDHMDEIIELYNEHHRDFSGTAVRPTYRMLDADGMRAYGWADETDKLDGYVRAVPSEDKRTLQCLEATGDPEQGLAVLKDLFYAADYESLDFFTLPHQHPILQILRKRACIVEERYFHNTGWRVRIVNLSNTINKIRPDLEKRLMHSSYKDWEGTLNIDAGEQKINLVLDRGKVHPAEMLPSRHSILGGSAIARLLIGSDDPAEVIKQEGMRCNGEGEGLTRVLFPDLHPVMSHWDEY